MGAPFIGASAEVMEHHAKQHGHEGARIDEVLCPCRNCVAIICRECDEPVFMAVRPGSWCEHAEELARYGRME